MKRDKFEVDNNAFFKESINMQDKLNENTQIESDLMNITIKSRNLAKLINKTDNRSIIDRNTNIIKNLSSANELKVKKQSRQEDEGKDLIDDHTNLRKKLNNK